MKLIPIAIAALVAVGANAAVITPQEALGRAVGEDPTLKAAASRDALKLVYTSVAEADGQPGCYVFAKGSHDGFVVVAADDLAMPLLGYADRGEMTAADGALPPNVAWWLSQYDAEIAAARRQAAASGATDREQAAPAGLRAVAKGAKAADRAAIPQMLSTLWNQGEPYNEKCPLDGGQRSVTGCVATAMAQIMKYHEWPDQGVGSYGYYWLGQEVSANFGETKYRWNMMRDDYTGTTTAMSREAVATLMYHCGVSVEMQYSASESGAYSAMVVPALMEYFKYNRATHLLERDWFTLDQWADIVYEQLAKQQPVYVSGHGTVGGHAFVCDGYRADGFFHFNFGWGGLSDGYYRLNAVTPEIFGIGGYAGGFNMGQQIIVDICPAGSPNASDGYLLFTGTDFTLDAASLTSAGTFTSDFMVNAEGNVRSYEYFEPGLRFESADGKTVEYQAAEQKVAGGLTYFTLGTLSAPTSLRDGIYTVTPAVRPAGSDWLDVNCNMQAARYAYVTVKGGKAVELADAPMEEPAMISFYAPSKFVPGDSFNCGVTLKNDSKHEYYGPVHLLMANDEGNIVWVETTQVDIAPGDTETVDFANVFYGPNITEEGKYTLYVAVSDQHYYYFISDGREVKVEFSPTGSPMLAVSKFYSPLTMSLEGIPRDDVQITAVTTCQRGTFEGRMTLEVYNYNWSYFGKIESEAFSLTTGQTAEVSFKGAFPNARRGASYLAVITYANGEASDYQLISFTDQSESLELALEDLWLRDEGPTLSDPVLRFSAIVLNNGNAPYQYPLVGYLHDYDSGAGITYDYIEDVDIAPGESRQFDFTVEIPDPQPAPYLFAIWYFLSPEEMEYFGPWKVDCTDDVGVESIEAASLASSATYYNMQGVAMPASALRPGVYVKIVRSADGRFTTEKVILR